MRIIPMDARPPQTYPAGRACCECGTELSRYNPTGFCSVHRQDPDWRYCGIDFGRCEVCGEVIEARKDRPCLRCKGCM